MPFDGIVTRAVMTELTEKSSPEKLQKYTSLRIQSLFLPYEARDRTTPCCSLFIQYMHVPI